MLLNRSVPDVQEKRKKWEAFKKTLCSCVSGELAFLDESGININLIRLYGRAEGGERVIDSAPVNTPASTTIVSAMTAEGPIAWDMWAGGTTKDRFIQYVRDELAPALPAGSTVVMDNLAAHHAREVQEILHEHGIRAEYLPPYSPDLNPIEMMWSKLKGILRKWRIRSRDVLLQAADSILQYRISEKDCTDWLSADGYYLPQPGG